MDPNKALETILSLASKLADDEQAQDEARDLAEHILGLDEWLHRSGFLPTRWSKSRAASLVPALLQHRGHLYRKV